MAVAFYYGAKFDAKKRCDARVRRRWRKTRRRTTTREKKREREDGGDSETRVEARARERWTVEETGTTTTTDETRRSRDAKRRDALFSKINDVPTVYETLSAAHGREEKINGAARGAKGAAGMGLGKGGAKGGDAKGNGSKAKKQKVDPEDALGLKKPSPGFILEPSQSLTALKNAQIELYWPDDNLWYRAEVISLNERNRTAKVLYATSDVETLNLDELIREGHVNIRRDA